MVWFLVLLVKALFYSPYLFSKTMNIQKISLHDVVFSGIHGATAAEMLAPQRFSIDASIWFDASPSIASGNLSDTVDYFDVVAVVREHIENRYRRHILLETLVDDIVSAVADRFLPSRIELSITKLDVPHRPSIGASRHYVTGRAVPMASLESIHHSLIATGFASTPFLTEDEREWLLAEARTLDYVRQPEVAESGVVREDLSSCAVKGEGNAFFAVADRLARLVTELSSANGFQLPALPKAHVALQKYEAGSFGITPHRDEKKYGVVICIIPLTGKGVLAACDNREGSNPVPVDTTPGNLVLLRAPGYAGMHARPMHAVSDITEERIVIGVRFPTGAPGQAGFTEMPGNAL